MFVQTAQSALNVLSINQPSKRASIQAAPSLKKKKKIWNRVDRQRSEKGKLHVLSCFVLLKKRSFSLLCVFGSLHLFCLRVNGRSSRQIPMCNLMNKLPGTLVHTWYRTQKMIFYFDFDNMHVIPVGRNKGGRLIQLCTWSIVPTKVGPLLGQITQTSDLTEAFIKQSGTMADRLGPAVMKALGWYTERVSGSNSLWFAFRFESWSLLRAETVLMSQSKVM